MMDLIQLFLENGLFKTLIKLSSLSDAIVSEPAQKLLKKLTLLIFNYFPDSSDYIDFLTTAVTTKGTTSIVMSSAAFIMNKIGNYVF